MPWFLDIAVYC